MDARPNQASRVQKLTAEAFGTFALVFAGTGAIVVNDVSGGSVTHVGVATTFGLIVMAMIFAVGDVSGAHLNPAVTFAFWVAQKIGLRDASGYISAQLVGALSASALLALLFPENPTLGATIPKGLASQSFILESLLTLILMIVILSVTTGGKERGLLAGMAVGGTVGLEAMFAGPICGASMNPARSLAPAIVSGHTEMLWVYVLAPLLGAFLAVLLGKILFGEDAKSRSGSSC